MPSITTQNVSAAVAQAVNQANVQTREQTSTQATPQQIAQHSQAAAERAMKTPKSRDKDRTPRIPKQVEGNFAKQSLHAKGRRQDSSDEQDEAADNPPAGGDSLDVLA